MPDVALFSMSRNRARVFLTCGLPGAPASRIMPHTFCRRRSPWSAQACLRLLWKPDFSQQIVINQGLKAAASCRTPRRFRRGMQKVCGIRRLASQAEMQPYRCFGTEMLRITNAGHRFRRECRRWQLAAGTAALPANLRSRLSIATIPTLKTMPHCLGVHEG
jgi:hypothetical protein